MTRFTPAVSLHSSRKFAMLAMLASLVAITGLPQASTAQARQATGQIPVQSRQIQTLAVVNGQEITRQQIAHECMRRFGAETVKSIINKQLIAEQLERAGLQITEQDIDQEIEKRGAPHGMSKERYTKTICKGKNLTLDEFRNNFIWRSLAMHRLAAKNITVTPQELNQRMEFSFGQRVQVRQIVLESLQQAQKIHAQAVADPVNFERLAKEFSVDRVSRPMGGLVMHAIRRNGGAPDLEQLIFDLQPGEVSRVLPVSDLFVVFKCERILPAEKISDEQLPAIHERLAKEISQEKLNQEAGKLFQRLEKETDITNVMNDAKLRKQMPGVAAIVNNRKILVNEVAEVCITRFGTGMLDTEINRTILLQALKDSGKTVEEADLNAEIYRAAKANGYLRNDQSVDEEAWLKDVTGGDTDKEVFYIEDEVWPTVALKQLVGDKAQVTQEDLNKSFEANFGERVEVLWIESNAHRKAGEIWNMAMANPTKDYFGELAHQYSVDPASMNNYGSKPPIRKHGGRPELEKVAFNLKPGEISKLIQMGENWVILYCLGYTDPVVPDLDAVREDLSDDILEKKLRLEMVKRFHAIRQDAQIDNFLKGTSQPGRALVEANRRSSLRR